MTTGRINQIAIHVFEVSPGGETKKAMDTETSKPSFTNQEFTCLARSYGVFLHSDMVLNFAMKS